MRLNLPGLQPSTNYGIQLQPYAPGVDGEWSRLFTITTIADLTPPAAPTNLTGAAVADSFHFEWDAVTTNANGKSAAITRYDVELTGATTKIISVPQKTDGTKVSFDLAFAANAAFFGTISGVVSARVRAVDTRGTAGAWAGPATGSNPIPAAVTALTATGSLNNITLNWSPVGDLDLIGYNVYLGATRIAFQQATSFSYNTTNYSAQTFTVKSVDKFNQESVGANATATATSPFVLDSTAPSAPTGLTATITTDTFGRSTALVSWTMTSPPTDLQGFQIRYRKVGDTNWLQATAGYDDRSMVVAIPISYSNYEFQIRAFDFSANFSAYTALATATGATNAAPAQTAGLTLAPGANAITAAWTEATEDDVRNGAGVYEVQFATNSGFTTGLLTYRTGANSITVTGLANGTQYFSRVRAVDVSGQPGTYSATANATTTVAPITSLSDGSAPTTSPTPVIVPGVGILNVSWTPVANNDLVTYEVHISTTTGFTPAAGTKVAEISGTSILLRNTATNVALTYGTTYFVKLIAKDRDGAAAAGAQASGIPLKAGATDITLTPADIGAPTTAQFNTAIKTYATEYSLNASETVAPVTGWSTTAPTRTAGSFIWTRVTVTYQDNTTSTTSPALLTGNTGAAGSPGTPAAVISLTGNTQILSSPAVGGTTNPATATVTGTPLNTTITDWQYSVDGGTFSATVPAGVSRTGNIVTITGSTMTARTIAVRMADVNNISDILTIAKVLDGAAGGSGTPGTNGADAYTVLLTNEAQTFAGSTTAALAGSATTSVLAYKGTVQQTATIGTITGQVTGLTTAITNNGTNNPTVTVTVTTSLTTTSGTLTIPVTVGGITFTKLFSWSLSLQGTAGTPGNNGVGITSVTPYFNQTTSGAAQPATPTASPPPAPWTSTEPGYVANTDLWRTERILFTDATFSYTTVNKASAYTAATTAITTANGKNKVTFSTTPTVPGSTANTAGDIWYVRDATGNIISIYEGGGGTTWTLRPMTDTVLTSVTAGKIATGTLSAITITIPATGSIQSADYAAGSAGFKLQSGSLEIRSGVIAANTIVSGTGIVNNLIVNTGGGVQSSNYVANTTGFRLSTTGLELNSGTVSASTLTAGTVSAQTISIGVGGTLSIDGSTAQLKSNNYALNSTGYRLSNAGLEINDGSIDAKAIKTSTLTASTITLATTGVIQSTGFSGTTGFQLSGSGLTINSGTIAARSLQLQFGENLMPPQFAAFEYPNSFYTSGMFVSQGSIIRSTNPTSKIGTQSYGTLWGVQASDPILYLGTSTTDYNILVTAGTSYIFSAYFWCAGTVATTIQFKVKWSTGAISTIATQALPASGSPATALRVSGVVAAPAGATGAVLLVDATTLTNNAGYNIDAVQVETQWSSQTAPSPWSPPGYTRIDGGIIRTGTIQSNVTGLVWNDTTQAFVTDPTGAPAWSIDVGGAATFNNLAVKGSVIVGNLNDATTAMPSISSANYAPGTAGWMIRSDGTSEFRQMVSESIIGDAIATNTLSADRLIASTIVSDLSLAGRLITPIDIRTITFSTTLNSNVVTSTVAGTFVSTDVGALLVGPGIPVNAKVVDVVSDTSIHITILASASGTNVSGTISSGRAVSVSGESGIQVLDTDGVTQLVSIPTDATQPNVFTGQLFADSLTVYDNFQMRGTNNSLLAGTSLTLNAQQGTPATPPSVNQSWYGYQSWFDGKNFTAGAYGFNYDPATSQYLVANNFFGNQLFKFAADGSFISNTTLPKGPETNVSDFIMYGGMVKVGTSYYGLGKLSTNSTWWLRQYNATLTTMTNNWAFTAISGTKRPAIGYDPSTNNLLVARCDSSGILKMSTHSTTTGAAIGGVLPTDLTPNTDITAIATGSFDMGAQFYVVQGTNSATYGKTNYVFTYNGVPPATQVKARSFPTANNAYQIGLCWNGTKFKSISSTGYISEYTSLADNVSNLSWHAKSSWYQATGNYETTMSSPVDFNVQRRAKITLSAAAIPASGSTNDPDRARFYVSTAATGTTTNFYRQADAGTGGNSLALTAAPAAVTNTTSGVTFPLSAPSSIVSSNGLLKLSSDGTAIFGSTQDANTSAGNLPALRVGDVSGTHLRIDGNEILAMSAPSTQDILYLNRGGQTKIGVKTWQLGTRSIAGVAGGGQTTVTITFPTPFNNPPQMFGQPITGASFGTTVNWWFGNITATDFDITVARSTSTATNMQWLAIDVN